MKLFILSALLLGTVLALPLSNENNKLDSKPVCKSKNSNTDFAPQNITFALLVQKSKDSLSVLLGMKEVADTILSDLSKNNKGWIGQFNYYTFDDKAATLVADSNATSSISSAVDYFIQLGRDPDTPYMCKDLHILDALILALSSPTATKHMQIFVYAYGGIKADLQKQKRLYELIDQLEPKIHVIQKTPISCYDVYDPAVTATESIAYYSGGTYSMSGEGASLLALPRQHNSAVLYQDERQKCARRQSYQFFVDSETTSLSLRISGDIRGDATFIPPNSNNSFIPTEVFDSQYDSLYTITNENLQSSEVLLPAGIWLVNFDVYDDGDEPTPCSLRVDAQSTLQLYRRFTDDITADDGSTTANYGSDKNRQIIHFESSAQDTSKLSINFARYFALNTEDLLATTKVSARDQCTYQFVSEPFNATQYGYSVQYIGVDAQGQRFQRILPAIALAN